MKNMKLQQQVHKVKWLHISLFYATVLAATFLARRSPNILNILLQEVTDIPFSFNYNHGFATLLCAILFYKSARIKQKITLFGERPMQSLLFPLILFGCYSIYGIKNSNGVDPHLWALLFCGFAFIYNIMEEYAWRGFLADALSPLNFVLKSIISGLLWAFWHLLVFNDFEQYGGFGAFLIFCIAFSFILTFAVQRTRSVIVAASIHTFIIQMNMAALICFIAFILLLAIWGKPGTKRT